MSKPQSLPDFDVSKTHKTRDAACVKSLPNSLTSVGQNLTCKTSRGSKSRLTARCACVKISHLSNPQVTTRRRMCQNLKSLPDVVCDKKSTDCQTSHASKPQLTVRRRMCQILDSLPDVRCDKNSPDCQTSRVSEAPLTARRRMCQNLNSLPDVVWDKNLPDYQTSHLQKPRLTARRNVRKSVT